MMNKHYLFGLALAASLSAKSQITIDFESTPLVQDTFNNGSDLSGNFVYSSIEFENVYDTTYSFNTGFSISNMMDVTTPGYTNQHSAFTGMGYNSDNYAVYYQTGVIDMVPITAPKQAMSVRLTNTTYSYLSMLNGDFAAKKFGDTVDANGANDGTNGEDFFILNIYGRKYNGDTLGMVEVVLADYRFADSTQDYIVDSWLDVNLIPANPNGEVDFLSFEFKSSDVGQWGINTPTYFAIDDFVFKSYLSVTELDNDFIIYPNPIQGSVYLKNATGNVSVRDAAGKLIHSAQVNGSTVLNSALWNSGVYFISISNSIGTTTKKVVK